MGRDLPCPRCGVWSYTYGVYGECVEGKNCIEKEPEAIYKRSKPAPTKPTEPVVCAVLNSAAIPNFGYKLNEHRFQAACAAMQGLLASGPETTVNAARDAVYFADALLAELTKDGESK